MPNAIGLTYTTVIFTVLIHKHTLERFEGLREKARKRHAEYYSVAVSQLGENGIKCAEKLAESAVFSRHPAVHRFNDIVGFAEIYFEGNCGIATDYYFRPDHRTRYGRLLRKRHPCILKSRGLYPLWTGTDRCYVFPHANEETRRALTEALAAVEKRAFDVKCFADTEAQRLLLTHLSIDSLHQFLDANQSAIGVAMRNLTPNMVWYEAAVSCRGEGI